LEGSSAQQREIEREREREREREGEREGGRERERGRVLYYYAVYSLISYWAL
jgi:hypothetical protein